MRKLVLLLAAALIVSVPVVTMSSSDTFAAAKAKKRAAGAAKSAPEAETGGLFRAFGDQMRPQAQPAPRGMGRVARAKRGKKKASTE